MAKTISAYFKSPFFKVRLSYSFFFILFLISIRAEARVSMSTGYLSNSPKSSITKDAQFKGVFVDGNYVFFQSKKIGLDINVGGSMAMGTTSWDSGPINRAGFFEEATADLLVDYHFKRFSVFGGFRIPVYSKAVSGGTFSTSIAGEDFKSASETVYSASGHDFYVGGDYEFGYFKFFSMKYLTSFGLDASFGERVYSLQESKVVSTIADNTSSPDHKIEFDTTSVRLFVKLRVKSLGVGY